MKIGMMVVMPLALTVLLGCRTSPQGKTLSRPERFKIAVPTSTAEIKQGDLRTVTVSLRREQNAKRDVLLEIKPSDGISVDPPRTLLRASDAPDVPIQILVPNGAGLGEYRVYVKGTPEIGEPMSTEFKVKVVAQ